MIGWEAYQSRVSLTNQRSEVRSFLLQSNFGRGGFSKVCFVQVVSGAMLLLILQPVTLARLVQDTRAAF